MHAGPPVVSGSAARCSTAATQSATASPDRGWRPAASTPPGRPRRGPPPTPGRSARTRRARPRRSRRRPAARRRPRCTDRRRRSPGPAGAPGRVPPRAPTPASPSSRRRRWPPARRVASSRPRCVAHRAAVRTLGVRLDDFDYELPPARIAQVPIEPRDAARLLVDRGARAARAPHGRRPARSAAATATCVVVNETRVIPARLRLRRATRRRGRGAPARAARRPTAGVGGARAPGPQAARRRGAAGGRRRAGARGRRPHRRPATRSPSSCVGAQDPLDELAALGEMPLPPYIHTPLDRPERYQTVYAARPGSAAAPTAGLHLTPELLAGIARRAASRSCPSSWSSGSTRSSRSPRTTRSTTGCTASATGCPTRRGRRAGPPARVVAVGTTCVRALESVAATGRLEGRTELFLHRGLEVQGRRRADDQLPPAPHDAADDDRRVRRTPLARALRRRRSPRATASCRSATPCSSTATPELERSVASPACTRSPMRDRGDRRRRPGRRGHHGHGAPTARRASCPSAPAAP